MNSEISCELESYKNLKVKQVEIIKTKSMM